ncbi:MAG: YbjN domain-containing protein [Clostridia bacterium]|nr:YbjN domain-containing protein [Clostridia bacterium]
MMKTTELIREFLNSTDRPFKRVRNHFSTMFCGARRMNAIRIALIGRGDGIRMLFSFPMVPEDGQMSGVREYLNRINGRLTHGRMEIIEGVNEIMYSVLIPVGQPTDSGQIFIQLRKMLCFGAMMIDSMAEDLVCLMAIPDADAAGRAEQAVLPELPYEWPDLPVHRLDEPEEEGDSTTHSIDKPDASLF